MVRSLFDPFWTIFLSTSLSITVFTVVYAMLRSSTFHSEHRIPVTSPLAAQILFMSFISRSVSMYRFSPCLTTFGLNDPPSRNGGMNFGFYIPRRTADCRFSFLLWQQWRELKFSLPDVRGSDFLMYFHFSLNNPTRSPGPEFEAMYAVNL